MPIVEFKGQRVECGRGENLRRVLMQAGLPLYNGVAKHIHCRGLGTCGTCAVEIQPLKLPGSSSANLLDDVAHDQGDASKSESEVAIPDVALVSPPTAVERWRLAFPPHVKGTQLRLACQCQVLADIQLTKYSGLWGHQADSTPE